MLETKNIEIEPQLQELINMGILPPALLEQIGLNKPLVINTDDEDLVRKTDFSHIKHEEIKVSKDKSIHVFDGIFNYA